MLFFWLGSSSVFVVTFLVLLNNQANLSQAPGYKLRLKTFLTTHQAEINRDPFLPELRSPQFQLTQAQLFEKLPAIIESLGWKIELTDSTNYLLEAVVATPLLGFKDDVDISILSDGAGSYLYANSRSRVGRADFAANSHHLQMLLQQIRKQGLQ